MAGGRRRSAARTGRTWRRPVLGLVAAGCSGLTLVALPPSRHQDGTARQFVGSSVVGEETAPDRTADIDGEIHLPGLAPRDESDRSLAGLAALSVGARSPFTDGFGVFRVGRDDGAGLGPLAPTGGPIELAAPPSTATNKVAKPPGGRNRPDAPVPSTIAPEPSARPERPVRPDRSARAGVPVATTVPAPSPVPDASTEIEAPASAPAPDLPVATVPPPSEEAPERADVAVLPPPDEVVSSAPDAQAERRLVELINRERAQAGLPGLAVQLDMQAVADRWSGMMVDRGSRCELASLRHNPDYAREMPDGWSLLAENVACGMTVDPIHQSLMASPGHRANILDGAFTHIGVGVAIAADGAMWVTQDFGQY